MLKYIIFIICFFILVLPVTFVFADSVTTSVTVGNSAPSFTAGPAENPSSYGTAPINAGSNIAFQATGTDPNNENYYLAVCKTNSITPVNGGAPTCGGGNWCISTSTTSGSQASCTYTTIDGDAESNDWYAFVCDGNSSNASCSATNQGSGNSGSPFKVNHRPVFNTISNDSSKNPGQNITWSTNVSTLDNDTDTTSDTVKLIICKTTGISGNDCDGGASDRWCASSFVASNPSCSYSIPTPTADQSYNAYAYLVDSHDFAATGANQGSNSSYVVNNTTPSLSSVTINGGSAITLAENTTQNITLTATVSDTNGCSDISSVTGFVYRSAIAYSGCDTVGEANNNYCYPEVSCSTSNCGAGSSADYSCTVALQFHADPTDSGTQHTGQTWKDTIKAIDNNSATDSLEVSTGVNLNSLLTMDMTSTIAYGNLGVGQKNDPLDKTTTVTATGNVGLDVEISGVDMDDGNSHTIPVGQQKYALASSTAYASGTVLTTSLTEAELNCKKTTITLTKETKDKWWGIEIPTNTFPASYTGTNTVLAVKGEIVNW